MNELPGHLERLRTLIIVPAHNEERNLPAAIEDLRVHAPWADGVVVDDCSTDATADVAENLDVTVLHEVIIEKTMGLSKESVRQRENLTYLRDPAPGLTAVDQREANFLFLLNPTKMAQVHACTAVGERMPQKSTDFYPKIVSGLVALPLSDAL